MKTSKYTKFAVIIMVILFVALSVISCVAHVHNDGGPKKMPPGQAKKMSGSQSAKAYAPGQQKKH
ncbi:hypothetical protein Q1W71_00835 [Flavobacterium pectinovorum]|jgi:hypothetical protein|uniref:hypothetical protein n=1 Tax=Flavobacterium TaxID=237 RepID=UPI0005AC5E79|nr:MULTISPECIES: hypothetical protein [Flavobacterium]KIQ22139.1 hypothetical protein RT99_08040 [Flavobacterium sp. MEB061]WKL48326.1 hypothetical protein Q1W71_00835 [Flavobacterium pectinovorum]